MMGLRIVSDFIDMIDLKRGRVVADRGFPPEVVMDVLRGRPGVEYLVPLERDRSVIGEMHLREFTLILPDTVIA